MLGATGTGGAEVLNPLVLVVDDNQDNLELIVQILELLNYDCICTETGEAGLVLSQTRIPDLILLDMCLPDMDGLEFIKEIKAKFQTQSIPIIAVTALAKSEDRERFLAAGCVDYVSKPFDLEELETTVTRYLTKA